MQCPVCAHQELKQGQYHGKVEVHACSGCHGIWLQAQALDILMGEVGEGLKAPNVPSPSEKDCPRCRAESLCTVEYPYTNVNLDMCRKCKGVWVEQGKLKQMSKELAEVKRWGLGKKRKKKGLLGRIKQWIGS